MAWGALIGLAIKAASAAVASNRAKKAGNAANEAAAAGGALQVDAARRTAEALNTGLSVPAQAERLGFSLEDVYGKRLEPPKFDFSEKDIFRLARRLGKFNANKGTKLANRSASRVNRQTLDDLEAGMRRLFGGSDGKAFDSSREKVNTAMDDWLSGRLSQPARKLLARRALSTGASGIGRGAVDDLYNGYLGIATEDIVGRGVDTYRSLYSMYRQSYPLVTGAQLMPFTTLSPETGVNLGYQTAVGQYEAGLNQAYADASPDPVASGLLADEMRRILSVSAAELGAQAQAGGYVSAVGSQAAGLGGSPNTQELLSRTGYGSFGGTRARI